MTALHPQFGRWLLSSLRSGLVAIDGTGHVLEMNADAHRVLFGGLDIAPALETLLGKKIETVLAGQPDVVEILRAALDGQERPSRAELTLRRRSGAPECTIGFTLTCVRDELGSVRGAAMQFRDLTAYERADEQNRLRGRLAALGEMAAGLAHELRNPLASAELLAGLVAREIGDQPEPAKMMQELLDALRAMASSIDSSLSFVRPEALLYEAVNPAELVRAAVERVSFEPSDVELATNLGPELPRVWLDAEKMTGVFANLLRNALAVLSGEERPSAPRVEVSLRKEPIEGASGPVREEIVWRVADNGPGVPEELRERIFYPFFTTRDQGSGVGLALAQKVVAAHGGTLVLEQTGAGASFAVRLPLREKPPRTEDGS